MSLKHSKTIEHIRSVFKEKGLKHAFMYCFLSMIKSDKMLLHYYPRFILTNRQYKIFRIARKHFNEKYKNIIAISPLFFIKNLKRHIAWLEQDEFQMQYKYMLPLELIRQLEMQNSIANINKVAPPPPC